MTDTFASRAAYPASQGKTAFEPLPFLGFLAIIAMFVPLNFNVGPINLTTSRLLFLFVVPFLTINLISGKYGKINIVDFLIYFHVFWLSLSIFINNPDVAVTFTGSNAVAILGGYLVARASVRTAAQFRTMVRLLGYLVIFMLPFAIIETLTGRAILREILNMLPGISVGSSATDEQRLGLFRVQFLFAHPIHFGFFCSIIFSLGVVALRGYLGPGRRFFNGLTVGMCCFLSLSSGAVLAMTIQAFLMIYQVATASIKFQWRLLLYGTSVFYIIAEIGSDRPALIAILSRAAFNPATVSIRQRLLEFGTDQIAKTPIFGVGFNDWGLPPWMSGSIDNFWLLQALIYGIPSLVGLGGAALMAMILVGRRDFRDDEGLRNCRLGWIFTMIGMLLTLTTVAVWGEIQSFVLFIIGSGVFMLSAQTNKADTETAEIPADKRALQYSRFAKKPKAERNLSLRKNRI